ncbi:MAG: hypothetical protein AAF750_05250 [Planctomycetota bacterium]
MKMNNGPSGRLGSRLIRAFGVVVLGAGLFLPSLEVWAGPGPMPRASEFLRDGGEGMEPYIASVLRYIRDADNAAEDRADAVWEAYMACRTLDHHFYASMLEQVLLARHLGALPTRFLAAGLADADEAAELFTSYAKRVAGRPAGQPGRLAYVLKMLVRYHGQEVLRSPETRLLAAVCLQQAGDFEAVDALRAGAEGWQDQALRSALAAALDGGRDAVERLDAMTLDHPDKLVTARRLVASALPGEDRARPEVRDRVMRDHLRDKQFGLALQELDVMSGMEAFAGDAERARLGTLRGVCLMVTRRNPEAKAAFEAVESAFPEDPWAAVAEAMRSTIDPRPRAATAVAEALMVFGGHVGQPGLRSMGFEAAIDTADGVPLLLGIGVNRDGRYRVTVDQGERLLLAWTQDRATMRVVNGHDGEAHQFPAQPRIMPRITVGLRPKRGGGYTFDFGFTGSDAGTDAPGLALPGLRQVLGSRQQVTDLMKYAISRGHTPLQEDLPDGRRRVGFVTANPDEPVLDYVWFTLDADGLIDGFESSKGRVSGLALSSSELVLEPVELPELEVIRHERFEKASFGTLLNVMTRVLMEMAAEPDAEADGAEDKSE